MCGPRGKRRARRVPLPGAQGTARHGVGARRGEKPERAGGITLGLTYILYMVRSISPSHLIRQHMLTSHITH